jgi:molecular chaperone DnaK
MLKQIEKQILKEEKLLMPEIILDSLIFATEKAMTDAGDKVPADKKTELEAAVAEAKTKLDSENLDEVKAATERLQNVSHSLAQDLYGQAGAGQPGAEGAGPATRTRG